MRIKLIGKIIEDLNPSRTTYKHETYSMFLSNINIDLAKHIHEKKKFKRLFTFSDLYIDRDNIHLYFAGEDNLIKDFINGIIFNRIIKIGDKVINITSIEPLSNKLATKEEYIFKGNIIVNQQENHKLCLSKDIVYIEKRINEIAKDKYSLINNKDIKDNMKAEILTYKQQYSKYKNHHLNSYKIKVKLTGNKELIETIYNVGIGENTASGHGFLWEVEN